MIAILGATGYVGRAFVAELHHRRQAFVPLSRRSLDYTRFDVLFNYVRNAKPRFIINAAGCTGRPNVEACDSARADAVHGNMLLPQTLARVCYLTKTPWGHVSTGSIFSGGKVAHTDGFKVERDLNSPELQRLYDAEPERFQGFAETDQPNCSFDVPPCNFYTGTKVMGEESLRWFDQGYVWRPGPMFDEADDPRNLITQIVTGAVKADGIGSLSHRRDFVRAGLDLWERNAPFGTYHVINPGVIVRKQLIDILERLGHSPPRMDSHEAARPNRLASPVNSILNSTKLSSAGLRLREVSEALLDSQARWQPSTQTAAPHQAFDTTVPL
jgi:dTDP-4-dehydrorhamnose reductase